MSEREKKDKANLASWKFRLEDTINGDPDAPKAGLKVIRVYLDKLTDDNPHPYAAMSVLMAKTGLAEATIRRTRDGLIALGYMVAKGISTDGRAAGATKYAMRNPREEFVEKLVEDRLKALRDEAREKVRTGRAAKEARDDVPLKNEPHTTDDVEAMSPQKLKGMSPSKVKGMSPSKMNPNTVYNSAQYTEGAAQAAPLQGTENNSDRGEPAFAYASRSPIGEEREDFSAGDPPSFDGSKDITADEANRHCDEAFAALCEGRGDPSIAGHDYQSAHDEAERQSFANRNQNADADASDRQLLERCERQRDRLPEFEKVLIAEMRQTLTADHDLTSGQKKFLRNEVMPIVRELENQTGPSEIDWRSKDEKNAANGDKNALAP